MQQTPDEKMIRTTLIRYLSGRMTLSAFRSWFVPATWDLDQSTSASLKRLVNKLRLRMAEYLSGHWTEEQLIDLLRALVPAERSEEDVSLADLTDPSVSRSKPTVSEARYLTVSA